MPELATTHCCGLDLWSLHVPGAGKTERHMSVSSAAIRGRNVCCLLPGSWADKGGSQSAIFKKAERETLPSPPGLSADLPLCLDRGADMQINFSFICSLSLFSFSLPFFLSSPLSLPFSLLLLSSSSHIQRGLDGGKKYNSSSGKTLSEPYG